jgi:hypothetical protein
MTSGEQSELVILRDRVRELEAALEHARAVAEAERRRADAANDSRERAWQVATFAGRRPRESSASAAP